MGLPEIIFKLKEKSDTAIKRSGNGVVALILADGTKTDTSYAYSKLTDVTKAHWTNDNYDYIRLAFLGEPKSVIVERVAATNTSYTDALKRLAVKKFNYLAVPGIASANVSDISDWISAQRSANRRAKKAVLPNSAGDSEAIINFTTSDIKTDTKTYTTAQYCARIAGLLAGIPLSQSSTYRVLPEVVSITESTTPDTDINAGKFILINDGAQIKTGRGVNSLQTVSGGKTEDMKKIKIVEGMDLIADDILSAFENDYVGQVANSYDNKQLFVTAVQKYINDMTDEGVLYPNFENAVYIDLDAQRKYLAEQGKDVTAMTDEEIKKANTGSKVFIAADLQFEDAMEDLTFGVTIE